MEGADGAVPIARHTVRQALAIVPMARPTLSRRLPAMAMVWDAHVGAWAGGSGAEVSVSDGAVAGARDADAVGGSCRYRIF